MNRINLICLGVQDMEKSLTFYKGLGFQTFEQKTNPPIVFFNTQGTKLELFPLEKLAQDINEENPPTITNKGFSGITLAINLESEAAVDDLMALAASLGATIAKAPEKVFWGGYSGYFQDLDGYYWEVAYGPNWQFDEHGMLVIEPED